MNGKRSGNNRLVINHLLNGMILQVGWDWYIYCPHAHCSLLQVVLEWVKQVPKHRTSQGIWSTRDDHMHLMTIWKGPTTPVTWMSQEDSKWLVSGL